MQASSDRERREARRPWLLYHPLAGPLPNLDSPTLDFFFACPSAGGEILTAFTSRHPSRSAMPNASSNPTYPPCFLENASIRFSISAGVTSSLCVEIIQMCPNGSSIRPLLSP